MYSFSKCLFSKWDVKTTPVQYSYRYADGDEVEEEVINYHTAFLPNEEALQQAAGTYSDISGHIQRWGVNVDHKVEDVSAIWMLDDPAVLSPAPTAEKLWISNIGLLYRGIEVGKIKDFPDVAVLGPLYSAPMALPGIQFNSGRPKGGGFYLVFRSDHKDPIDLKVFCRYSVNVHNN